MGELISLLESPGLPPVVQLFLFPFALIGAAPTAFKAWEQLVHLFRHRLTHRATRQLNRRSDIGAIWTLEGIGILVRARLARCHNPDDYIRTWKD